MRGKAMDDALNALARGITPRACGEKRRLNMMQNTAPGSPPRMRGKVGADLAGHSAPGITPAHAGKSKSTDKSCCRKRDHPRACGEKFNRIAKPFREQGSPPRMRGKVLDLAGYVPSHRITPTHAGKSPPACTM